MTEKYKVQLEIFEGPLDLLLYLIKREEIDIYDIPIDRITTQYMEYLDMMKMLDLDIAGEFVLMAATLMYIKSRLLLPPEEQQPLEEEEEDPRQDLIRQLLEYKKFKESAPGAAAIFGNLLLSSRIENLLKGVHGAYLRVALVLAPHPCRVRRRVHDLFAQDLR